MHTFLQARIGWCTMGWPAKGNKGFAKLNERGLNRVPSHSQITRADIQTSQLLEYIQKLMK